MLRPELRTPTLVFSHLLTLSSLSRLSACLSPNEQQLLQPTKPSSHCSLVRLLLWHSLVCLVVKYYVHSTRCWVTIWNAARKEGRGARKGTITGKTRCNVTTRTTKMTLPRLAHRDYQPKVLRSSNRESKKRNWNQTDKRKRTRTRTRRRRGEASPTANHICCGSKGRMPCTFDLHACFLVFISLPPRRAKEEEGEIASFRSGHLGCSCNPWWRELGVRQRQHVPRGAACPR